MISSSLDVVLAVDALSPRPSGIGRYVRELWDRLPEQPHVTRVQAYRNGYLLAEPLIHTRTERPRWRQYISNRPRFIRRWLTRQRCHAALFHGPNFFLPPWVEQGIITVHDLSVFRYPDTHPADRIRQFERDFARSIRQASHIITDSETVRCELISDFSVSASRVHAVHLGVSDAYRPRAAGAADAVPRAALASRLDFGSYTLCVSTLEPRKNIERLMNAYAMLPMAFRHRHPLVIAGGDGWLNEALKDRVTRCAGEGWLVYLGYVNEADLPALYAGARLFAYPSSYEGFGLPPVEAMASGVPTVVANRSCLPEVTGGAALLVEPDDAEGFAESIKFGLLDEPWRAEAVRQGLAVARRYTWSRCVEQTVDVYLRARGAASASLQS